MVILYPDNIYPSPFIQLMSYHCTPSLFIRDCSRENGHPCISPWSFSFREISRVDYQDALDDLEHRKCQHITSSSHAHNAAKSSKRKEQIKRIKTTYLCKRRQRTRHHQQIRPHIDHIAQSQETHIHHRSHGSSIRRASLGHDLPIQRRIDRKEIPLLDQIPR